MSSSCTNVSHNSIFENPVITYNVFLPGINQICPLKFHDDEIYDLPYIKSIPMNCTIRDQLPESSRTQQFLISRNGEESIHAESAMEKFTRLRTTHTNELISLSYHPEIQKQQKNCMLLNDQSSNKFVRS